MAPQEARQGRLEAVPAQMFRTSDTRLQRRPSLANGRCGGRSRFNAVKILSLFLMTFLVASAAPTTTSSTTSTTTTTSETLTSTTESTTTSSRTQTTRTTTTANVSQLGELVVDGGVGLNKWPPVLTTTVPRTPPSSPSTTVSPTSTPTTSATVLTAAPEESLLEGMEPKLLIPMVVGLTLVVLLSILAVAAVTRNFYHRRQEERELEDRRTKRYVSPDKADHHPDHHALRTGSKRSRAKSEEIEMTDDIAAMHEMCAVIESLELQEEIEAGFANANGDDGIDVFAEIASSHVQDYVAPPSDTKEITAKLEEMDVAFLRAESVTLMASIGTGRYGQVYKAMRRYTGNTPAALVAAKTVEEGHGLSELLLQEAAIRAQFRHPYVVSLVGIVEASVETGRPLVLMEYMQLGSLDRFLRRTRPAVAAKLRICSQVAAAMEYLTRCSYVVGGLAARNIFVSENYTCKVSVPRLNRGSDPAGNQKFSVHKLNVRWSPPELLTEGDATDAFEGKTGDSGIGRVTKDHTLSAVQLVKAANSRQYTAASDVWAYGVVVWEVFSCAEHIPYVKWSNSKVIRQVKRGHRLPPPTNCPREIYAMMMRCWHPEPDARITAQLLATQMPENEQELDFSSDCEDLQGIYVKSGGWRRQGSRLSRSSSVRSKQSHQSENGDAIVAIGDAVDAAVAAADAAAAAAATGAKGKELVVLDAGAEQVEQEPEETQYDEPMRESESKGPTATAPQTATATAPVPAPATTPTLASNLPFAAAIPSFAHLSSTSTTTPPPSPNRQQPQQKKSSVAAAANVASLGPDLTEMPTPAPTPPDSPLIHRSLLEIKPDAFGDTKSGKRSSGYNTGTGSSRPSISYASTTGSGSSGRLSRSFLYDAEESGSAVRTFSDSPHSSVSRRTGRSFTQRLKPKLKPVSDKYRDRRTVTNAMFSEPEEEIRPVSSASASNNNHDGSRNSIRSLVSTAAKQTPWLSAGTGSNLAADSAAATIVMRAASDLDEAERDSYITIMPEEDMTLEGPSVQTRFLNDTDEPGDQDGVRDGDGDGAGSGDDIDGGAGLLVEQLSVRRGSQGKSALALAMEGARSAPHAKIPKRATTSTAASATKRSSGPKSAVPSRVKAVSSAAIVAPPRSPASLKHRVARTPFNTPERPVIPPQKGSPNRRSALSKIKANSASYESNMSGGGTGGISITAVPPSEHGNMAGAGSLPRSRSNTDGSQTSANVVRSSWPSRKSAPTPKRFSWNQGKTNGGSTRQMDPAEEAAPGTELPLLASTKGTRSPQGSSTALRFSSGSGSDGGFPGGFDASGGGSPTRSSSGGSRPFSFGDRNNSSDRSYTGDRSGSAAAKPFRRFRRNDAVGSPRGSQHSLSSTSSSPSSSQHQHKHLGSVASGGHGHSTNSNTAGGHPAYSATSNHHHLDSPTSPAPGLLPGTRTANLGGSERVQGFEEVLGNLSH